MQPSSSSTPPPPASWLAAWLANPNVAQAKAPPAEPRELARAKHQMARFNVFPPLVPNRDPDVPRFQPPVPGRDLNVPKAQQIESIEYIDVQRMSDRVRVDVIEIVGHIQPKSPHIQPKSPAKAKPSPFNTFISRLSVPSTPDPFRFKGAVNSRKATNEEMARSANWAKSRRELDEPSVGHAACSLTAVGSSPASSPTAAGGGVVTRSVQDDPMEHEHDQLIMAPESTNIPAPTVEDPWRARSTPGGPGWILKPPVAYQTHPQFGIFGSMPGPIASSLTAAGDQPVKYSQKSLCVEYISKSYEEMVAEFDKFDPVAAAREYDFTMSKSTDPVEKQIAARLREMRRLVFEVQPDHAHRHLKWWKTQENSVCVEESDV